MNLKAIFALVRPDIRKKKRLMTLFILFIVFGQVIQAQTPKVPTVIDFAGIKLRLSEQVKKDIQSDVDALYRNEKYFKIKVDRVNLYLPIIERILKEEKLPDDFKYLVIQESSLISDAISTSNAVGFWQFKQDAGEEVGLKINGQLDERMNIVASTRGAAIYLKKHNSYFNNWLYSLLAYNMGRGGARSVVDPKYFGAERMDIDKNTHWYILKYLAHKIAFENALGKNPELELMLVEYTEGTNKSLKEISHELDVEIDQLEFYNKWLKKGKIPADKVYTVIIPVSASKPELQLAVNEQNPTDEPDFTANDNIISAPSIYPIIEGDLSDPVNPLLVIINGRPGIVSRQGDNVSKLASQAGLRVEKFKKINDLKANHKVIPGQYYYLKAKSNNAPVHKHTVQPGETLWDISQMYGIKERSILRKNRMASASSVKPGLVLWLRFIRPSKEPVSYSPVVAFQQNEVKNNNPSTPLSQPVPSAESEKKQNGQKPDLNEDFNKEGSGQGIQNSKITNKESAEKNKVEVNKTKDSQTNALETDNELIAVEKTLNNSDNNEDEIIIVKKEPVDSVNEINKEKPTETKNEQVREIENFKNESESFGLVEDIQNKDFGSRDQHVVKQGETLYGIARNYAIPLRDLASWNNLNFEEGIKIGQVLTLKSPIVFAKEEAPDVRKNTENVQEHYIDHKVAAGETLYKIAREHNVTIKEVMEWNKKTDFSVALGEVIKIKKLIVNE